MKLLACRSDVAGRRARKNTMAGRENRVRRISDDFNDYFTADTVGLSNPSDDDE